MMKSRGVGRYTFVISPTMDTTLRHYRVKSIHLRRGALTTEEIASLHDSQAQKNRHSAIDFTILLAMLEPGIGLKAFTTAN